MSLLIDALLDTAKAFPFLFGAYVLLEWLAHRAGEASKGRLKRLGKIGSVGGALLGLIPQCGFSVVAASFYADRVITPGTLLAVFIATSDEALPILLTPAGARAIMPLVAVKVVIAVAVGLFVDFALARLWRGMWERDSELRHLHLHGHGHRHADGAEDSDDDHCHHNHCEGGIVAIAFRHALRVSAIVFAVTLALCFALEALGGERTAELLLGGSRLQPVAAALFGLVPSCAVSVVLAKLYLEGTITFGSVVAGLCTGAGMGTLVLFQSCRRKGEAVLVLSVLFATGSVAGLLLDVFGVM